MKQGIDYDGWAWETKQGNMIGFTRIKDALGNDEPYGVPGRWVRVKLVKVEPKKRKAKRG